MKKLLVMSNHPVNKWSDEQKAGWDEIEYIPFPVVDPNFDREGIITLADQVMKNIKKTLSEKDKANYKWTAMSDDPHTNIVWLWDNAKSHFCEWSISLQGEFSLCNELFQMIGAHCVFPSTERVVEEKDGVKTSVFKFVKWR